MTPIQQLMLGVGGAKKTYIDDLFNTDLWTGDGASHQVVNNINLSGDGGMVWMKSRSHANNHMVADTVRGSNKVIFPDGTSAEQTSTGYFTSLNSNGFTTGDSSYVYESGKEMAGWSFKKAKGFFDVVTYTGSGSTQQIAHNLGSIPGCYMIKNTSNGGGWMVYHRHLNNGVNAANYRLELSGYSNAQEDNVFGDTAPTATHFTAGSSHQETNQSGHSYVCYLFAGGESTAATARSVSLDGDEDELVLDNNNAWDFGANDFTIECWVNPNSIAYTSYYKRMWSFGNSISNSMTLNVSDGGQVEFRINNSAVISTGTNSLPIGSWSHLAVVRHSNTIKLYLNGSQVGETYSISGTLDWSQSGEDLHIGTFLGDDSSSWNGKISNFRIVKGTAVYTSSFIPPTEPLTNINNTVLLCCNNSSVTGSTVTPGTINTSGSPTASTDSPFEDPAGFIFGENEDQNVIKCGSFIGGGSTYRDVYVGFEPQWILLKNSTESKDWKLFDCIRGLSTGGGDDAILDANENVTEVSQGADALDITPTGFRPVNSSDEYNGSGDRMIYIAIRRKDGYVGKPAENAAKMFTPMVGSSGAPVFKTNGFPTDFHLQKNSTYTSGTSPWSCVARIIGDKQINTEDDSTPSSNSTYQHWDYMNGTNSYTGGSGIRMGYSWRRYEGLDAVTYRGNGINGHAVRHNLNGTPEMIWTRCITNNEHWVVGHSGMNGGTNPWEYYLRLNTNDDQVDSNAPFYDIAPTSTHFTLGTSNWSNMNNQTFMAVLFRSISGISKCGRYAGSGGSGNAQNIGFQPRFILIKRAQGGNENWLLMDSVNGFDKYMLLNSTQARSSQTFVSVSSTGFSFSDDSSECNGSGSDYIYYAHA